MLELVIFDNDGVLVDSERLANGVLSRLLTECGLEMSEEECIERFMGGSIGRVRREAERLLERPLPGEFEDDYHRAVLDGFRTSLRPVPGIEQALSALTIATCVASSGTHERIRLALEVTGLLPLFDGRVFSADDVARGKPHPDLFEHAASVMGVAPAGCVVVEDSPLGVAAARAAGMRVVGYAAMTPTGALADATAVISSMDELSDVLTAL